MAQRLSEQVVEWLTVGGDSFTPHFKSNDTKTSVPLVVNKPGTATTFPTTGGTAIGIYNNQGQIWTLGAAAASTSQKSSQVIISSSDAGAGDAVGLEFWRGTNASWQILNKSESSSINGILYIGNNYTTSAQSSYITNLSMRYGAVADQYVRIHSTKDSDYEHTATGAALIVDGGATFKKKVYIDDDTDSNYVSGADGALVVNGGASIGGKLYVGSNQASTSSATGALVVNGGVGIAGDTNIATNKYLKVGQYITIGGNGDPADRSVLSSTTLYVGSSGNASLIIKTNNINRARFESGGHFRPEADSTYNVGTSSYHWSNGYFDQISISTDTNFIDSSSNYNGIRIGGTGDLYINRTASGNGIFLRGNQVDYGRFYVHTIGKAPTATTTDGTTTYSGATVGVTYLILGNNKVGANSSAGVDNNARGYLRIYGSNANYTDLITQDMTTSRTTYLPNTNTDATPILMATHDLSGAQDLNGKYNAGIYCIEGGSVTNYPAGGSAYANLLVIPYRKPYGNTKPDYAVQIYGHSADRLWFRGSSDAAWRDWRELAHIAANTAVGSATQGTYVTAAGVVTAMTYSLNATVNAGTAKQAAYYSGANAISGSSVLTIESNRICVTANSNTVSIGSQNASFCHIYNSASIPFIFNNTVATTSGDLGTATYPWGTFYWKGLSYVKGDRSRYSFDLILQNGAGNTFGEFWYDRGNATNITMGSWRFREYSPNSTANTATTGYYEDFYLPNVTSGRTSNASYTIYTTKNNPTFLDIYEARSATTNLNKAAGYSGVGRMFHLVASSSTTTGKTPTDANILQMNWDNNGGYDSQFGISTSDNRGFLRSQVSAGNAWREIATIAAGTATGGARTPVYVSATGKITACQPEVAYWTISNTAAAASGAHDQQAARQIAAVQGVFSSHNNSIPEAFTITTGNTSVAFGYLISGTSYNTTGTAYGGYFIAHYGNAKYMGISNGTWQVHRLVFGCSGGYYGALSSRPSTANNGDVYFATL